MGLASPVRVFRVRHNFKLIGTALTGYSMQLSSLQAFSASNGDMAANPRSVVHDSLKVPCLEMVTCRTYQVRIRRATPATAATLTTANRNSSAKCVRSMLNPPWPAMYTSSNSPRWRANPAGAEHILLGVGFSTLLHVTHFHAQVHHGKLFRTLGRLGAFALGFDACCHRHEEQARSPREHTVLRR